MKGFIKNQIALKVIIPICIVITFVGILILPEHINEEQEILNLDITFDYYNNITKGALDKYCNYVRNGNRDVVAKLVNKEICNCSEYIKGKVPKWFNLKDLFFNQNEIGYLYRLGFTTNLDNFRFKKNIEFYHMKTGEKIRYDMWHEDLDELEIYIRYVKYINDDFKYIITTEKFIKDEILSNDIGKQKYFINKTLRRIQTAEKQLKDNNINKNQYEIIQKNMILRLKEQLLELNKLDLEMKKRYYDKLELRKEQLMLYQNIKPHYHRLTIDDDLKKINPQKDFSYYWNKCGNKILDQSDPDHQIFGRIK